MPTLAEIQQFITANINKPNAAQLISDAAIQNNVSLAQLAEAASGALGRTVTQDQVQGYFQNAWQSDNDPATSGMTNYLPPPAQPTPTATNPALGMGVLQTTHDLSHQRAREAGYTQTEGGRWTNDGESFLNNEQIGEMFPPEADADPLIGGVQYRNIEGWANNTPDDQNRGIQAEIEYLRGFGLEPINHPQYGWIVPQGPQLDAAHDPNYAANNEDWLSRLGTLGPFILGGGMAALSAGLGAGVAGTYSTLGGVPGAAGAAAGTLSAADIAGLTRMGQDAGLTGPALEAFVNAGGGPSLAPF